VRTLRALARAAASSRSAELEFLLTERTTVEHLVDVLAVAFDGERWAVSVWDVASATLRVLDAERVSRVRPTLKPASPPPDGFDAREFAWQPWLEAEAGSPEELLLWADAHAAPIILTALPVLRTSRAQGGGGIYRVRTSLPARLAALTRSLSPCAAVHSASMTAPSRPKEDTAEARLLRLASWLLEQGEAVTRSQIFEAFPEDYRGKPEAAERKFTRDKEALRHLGYVIGTVELGSREGPGYVLSARACTLPKIALAPEEAALVWSAATAASRLSLHPMRDELESALRKLVVGAQGLPPRAAAIEELATDAPANQEKTLERLIDAWERRKRLTIDYWRVAADEVVERQVDVYGWASRRGEWILVGYCHLRKGVRIFYLSRVRKLRVNGVRAQDPDYRVPKDFDIRRWSRQQVWDYDVHPPRPVTVRFRGSLARIARNLLPGATTTLDMEGGRVSRIEVRNLRGLVRQLLAWGPEAELVEPEEGRALAREILTRLAGAERRTG
jgi:proteasome accessory factor B